MRLPNDGVHGFQMEPPATNDWLDVELEVPRPDRGQDGPGDLPKQVTTLPELRRMYPAHHAQQLRATPVGAPRF